MFSTAATDKELAKDFDLVKSTFNLNKRPHIIVHFEYNLLKCTRNIETTFTEFLYRVVDSATSMSPNGRATVHLVIKFRDLARLVGPRPTNPFKKSKNRPSTRVFLRNMVDKFNNHYKEEVIDKFYIYLDQDIAGLLNPFLNLVSKTDAKKLEFRHKLQL